MTTHSSSSLLAISLLASFAEMGCGSVATAPHVATDPAVVMRPSAQVDEGASLVRAPGEVTLRRAARTTVAKQVPSDDEAAESTDCSRGAKVCIAKGFVYDKVSPAMPDINAHGAPPREVAHR